MFRPSAPTSLSLSGSFILRYVTASSSATSFTPTMASSEDPLSITHTLLCRLGLSCRSYNGPVQTAPHRVRSRTFSAHPPPLPCGIRKGYRASVMEGTSPLRRACQRFAPSLSGRFDAGFLQIPHWLSFTGVFLLGQIQRVSSGTLAIVYIFPPFRAMAGLSPASS
jgi:hypothetical protein